MAQSGADHHEGRVTVWETVPTTWVQRRTSWLSLSMTLLIRMRVSVHWEKRSR